MTLRYRLLIFGFVILSAGPLGANEPRPKDTQQETVPFPTPAASVAGVRAPEGFQVSLFASEPLVRQPIGFAFDERGRLWVAENHTYAEAAANFDLSQFDRIAILTDDDRDGRADRSTVFWDKAQRLTSVAPGPGGAYALCPPALLFLPDGDRDDRPDGEPVVLLDGFDDAAVRHNIANGLRWGPDGWLYGRHGILATSLIGPPGSSPGQRIAINCGIWRYHPVRKLFEVVCRGTTNPWGMDWDRHGELFFINTVIGHLWHAVPGAHFQRMYGEDDNPNLYNLIGQTADHFHWDTAEAWHDIRRLGVTPTTDEAGGGHAHSGLLIYQGNNWPERYRGTVLTINFHGRRLNNDTLERRGAGYVARHSPDVVFWSDPWFRGIDLVEGPEGDIYVADWSDIGECHDNDGVHRSSGRIYRIARGRATLDAPADLAGLSDGELIQFQRSASEWLVRQSRQLLAGRAAAGRDLSAARARLRDWAESDPDPLVNLRSLWALYVMGGTTNEWLIARLGNPDEHVRAWAARLLVDGENATPAAARAFATMAAGEPSGLVLVYLASALQRITTENRWPLARALVSRSEFAGDPVLALMIWYGIEGAVADEPARALDLAAASAMPVVVRALARRLTENLRVAREPVDRLIELAANAADKPDRTRAILGGMADALRGWHKAPMPSRWRECQPSLAASSDDQTRRLARELSAVFGDGRALEDLREIAAAPTSDLLARRQALRVLVEARAAGVLALLVELLGDRDLSPDAASGLAASDDPGFATVLIDRYPRLAPSARAAALATLCSRASFAARLLEAVAAGQIARDEIPTFELRRLDGFADPGIQERVAALWPELKATPGDKRDKLDRYRALLAPAALAQADPRGGRQRFAKACANCHVLFGQGSKIGPDLTGAQRANVEYLLENLVTPSATVPPAYRMATLALADGRVLSGLVVAQSEATVSLQTPTELLVLDRSLVSESRPTELSLMPEGLLDRLSEREIRDLFAYLMSPRQVPLPDAESAAARPVPSASAADH